MENIPLIHLLGYNLPPEIEEKYNNWSNEVYSPTLVKLTPINELERYRIIKRDSSYPDYFALWHFDNLEGYLFRQDAQFSSDLGKDIRATFNKMEWVWRSTYYLMRSFRKEPPIAIEKGVIKGDNPPVIHLEAFTSEKPWEYGDWCVKYANRIYLPALMKIPGIRGYDRYRNAGIPLPPLTIQPVESNYPLFLQVVYFEDLQAFENYERSPELASFKKAMKSDLSETLVPQWYVQYKLLGSWRK